MRFDDMGYVRAYRERGEYPAIHDDIFTLDDGLPRFNVADMGACHGLLAARLVAAGHGLALAFEPSNKYLREAVRVRGIEYVGCGFYCGTASFIADRLIEASVQIVFARRVIPEIWDAGGIELVRLFADTLRVAGVRWLAIEGRVPTSKAVNGLSTIDREIEALRGFSVSRRYKNCALMERIVKL